MIICEKAFWGVIVKGVLEFSMDSVNWTPLGVYWRPALGFPSGLPLTRLSSKNPCAVRFCPWVRPRKQPCVRFWKYLWRSFNILPREPIENSSETHRDSSMPIVPVCWDSRHTAKYSYFFVTAETLNINTQQVLNIQRWIIGTLSIHTRHSQHPHSAHSASHSAVSAFTLGTCWVYSQQSQQMRWAETFSSVCCNSLNPYPSLPRLAPPGVVSLSWPRELSVWSKCSGRGWRGGGGGGGSRGRGRGAGRTRSKMEGGVE